MQDFGSQVPVSQAMGTDMGGVHADGLRHASPCPFPLMLDPEEEDKKRESVDLPPLRSNSVEDTRCYWAICKYKDSKDSSLLFVYLDPRAYKKIGNLMYQSSLMDFVQPSEQPRVRDHLRTIMLSQTLFGSVMQCRFVSLSSMYAYLRGINPPAYNTTDIIVSWLNEDLALCFFHAVDDATCACGLDTGTFNRNEVYRLWDALSAASDPQPKGPLSNVFQILSTDSPRTILMSWPPPGLYNARDFASLVEGASSPDGATCTQRLRASHALHTQYHTFTVASVLVPCASVLLACFQITDEQALPPGRRANAAPDQQSKLQFASAVNASKKCSSCGKTDSPEWRRGPSGQKTVSTKHFVLSSLTLQLCNACGLRFSRSLTSRRRRDNNTSLTINQESDEPAMVPRSRGAGGGSRPGTHRRNHRRVKKSKGQDETRVDELSEYDRRLAHVLASLPDDQLAVDGFHTPFANKLPPKMPPLQSFAPLHSAPASPGPLMSPTTRIMFQSPPPHSSMPSPHVPPCLPLSVSHSPYQNNNPTPDAAVSMDVPISASVPTTPTAPTTSFSQAFSVIPHSGTSQHSHLTPTSTASPVHRSFSHARASSDSTPHPIPNTTPNISSMFVPKHELETSSLHAPTPSLPLSSMIIAPKSPIHSNFQPTDSTAVATSFSDAVTTTAAVSSLQNHLSPHWSSESTAKDQNTTLLDLENPSLSKQVPLCEY